VWYYRSMTDTRISLPTVIILLAVVGAGAFAAGRSMPGSKAETTAPPMPAIAPERPPIDDEEPLPPGHPPTGGSPGAADMPGMGMGGGAPDTPESTLEWKAPPKWELVPNASTMRLATYKVPRAAGDTSDAELSITQAGGSVDANADRWIGQFDAAGQKSAKRTMRKVGPLQVTIVEAQGIYSAGMGKGPESGWALLGAIVATPGMPHFFKLTGPAKTVLAARADFDAMIGSLGQR
jgi:hypothetical protein